MNKRRLKHICFSSGYYECGLRDTIKHQWLVEYVWFYHVADHDSYIRRRFHTTIPTAIQGYDPIIQGILTIYYINNLM